MEGDEGDEETEGSLISQLPLPEILQKNLAAKQYTGSLSISCGRYIWRLCLGVSGSGNHKRTVVSACLCACESGVACSAMLVLDMIAGLPLISGANRLTGGIVGVAKGILFIWIALLLLTILCSSDIGKRGLELVEKDSILQALYKHDVLVNFFMDIFYKN